MPTKVVSNTSPLISLYLIDKFDVLHQFFDKILIPEAVWKELTEEDKEGSNFF